MDKGRDDSNLPQPGEGKRGERGYLGYLLRQAANAYRNRVEQVLRDLALTLPQFSALTMLGAYPGHSNADLARLAFLTPQTMNVITTNLKKAGLIRRKPHKDHGRIQQLELTQAGKSALSRAKQRVTGFEQVLLAGMSAEEARIVRHWLVSVATRA